MPPSKSTPRSLIVGTSLYLDARFETLPALEGSASSDPVVEVKRRFGLSLGPSMPHAPCGALVVAVDTSSVSAVVAVGDIILAVNGVNFEDVDAVQGSLLGACGVEVQVAVRSPASLESAYDVLGILGKGKQGVVVRAVSKSDGTHVAVKTVSTARPSFRGLTLSKAMLIELRNIQDDLLRREVELASAQLRFEPPHLTTFNLPLHLTSPALLSHAAAADDAPKLMWAAAHL